MITSEVWIWAATCVSFLIVLLHIFGGGKQVVPPLFNSDLSEDAKFLNYYCWHLVTITLIAMTAAFYVAAKYPDAWELAMAATLLSSAFALWSAVMIVWKRLKWFAFPQWLLFIILSAVGAMSFV